MRFGVNDGTLEAFEASGIPVSLVRQYNSPKVGVPASFPGPDADKIVTVANRIVSIRPDVNDVIAGKLDSELKRFFASVPKGAYVTAWHEGEGARFGYSPVQIVQMHDRLMGLFDQSAPLSAFYGQIFMTYSASPEGRGIKQFMCPWLDFYGLDAYGDGSNRPVDVILPAFDQLAQPGGETPEVLITESNTPNPSQVVAWHEAAYRLARDLHCGAYVPYFGTGTGSQVFDPTNAALVATLKEAAGVA